MGIKLGWGRHAVQSKGGAGELKRAKEKVCVQACEGKVLFYKEVLIKMKFKKLFVTGALGRVGTRVLPSLAKEISLKLTDREAGSIPVQDGEALPVEPLHLSDFPALCEAMQGCDVVLHLAIASEREFLKQYPGQPLRKTADMTLEEWALFEQAMLETNVKGTYNVFEAARKTGVKRVLYMSSLTTVLGHTEAELLTGPVEDKPCNFYAVTKLFGEQMGDLYHRCHGLEVLSMRLGQPYPVGSYHDDSYLATPLRRLVNAHLDDIARMLSCCLKTDLAYGVFNLCSEGDPYTVDRTLWDQLGYRPKVRFTEQGMECN